MQAFLIKIMNIRVFSILHKDFKDNRQIRLIMNGWGKIKTIYKQKQKV